MICSSLGSSEESAELFCDKSWFQIDANCKTFPQDLRNGTNWSADPRGATRMERRQQLWILTSRQLHLKPFVRVTWNSILPEPCATDHVRRSQLPRITSDPMEVDTFGRGGKKGNKGKKGKKGEKKKVNIRIRVGIQTRTLFVGTVVRKAILAQNVGQIHRISPAPVQRR